MWKGRFRTLICIVMTFAIAGGCSDNDTTTDAALSDGSVDLAVDAALKDVATDAGPLDAGPQLPDVGPIPSTPIGKKLAWLIGEINAGTLDETKYNQFVSSGYQQAVPFSTFEARYGTFLDSAPLQYHGLEAGAKDNSLVARLYGARGPKIWSRLGLYMQPSAQSISGIGWKHAPDLDPSIGMIGNDEIGLMPYDPNTYNPTTYTVELLDRNTGTLFSPTVSGKTDAKYSYVRLKIPAGHTEVGLRVTHSDGEVTDNYAPTYVGGADHDFVGQVAGFNGNAFTSYVASLSIAKEAGKAQVWGSAKYGPPANPYDAWDFNSRVGCATATFNPAVSTVYYTVPPNYWPTQTATQTHPNNPTFFAFNVSPVSHTVTLDAGGKTLAVTFPPFAADHITTLWMKYSPTTHTTNPTPSGCNP